jgi:hypothetical protein
MHFVGDVVAVPFIWQTGQQGFRYAKVCWKDALIEASTKGLYQLDASPNWNLAEAGVSAKFWT